MKRFLYAGVLALLVSTVVTAEDHDCGADALPGTLYGLAQDGRMSANGTTTKVYPSDFFLDIDVDDERLIIILPDGTFYIDPAIEIDLEHPEDLWGSLDADGPDRYALQRSGRMKKNDKTAYDLPRFDGDFWLDMVAVDGDQYSIRNDGALAVNANIIVDRAAEGFEFRRVIVDRGDIFVLRADGNVYMNQQTNPLFTFRAGEGDRGALDGRSNETKWIALAIAPLGNRLFALRADGWIFSGELSGESVAGDAEAALPHNGLVIPATSERYHDLVFTPDGTWYALQADGRVYTDASDFTPLVDLPGNANDIGRIHVDLDVFEGQWLALRSDGRVYLNGNETEIIDLPGESYGSMALSDQPPTLKDDGSAKPPKATIFKVKSVVGTPLRVPVTVTDADTCPDALVITAKKLPVGATFDAETATLIWDAPGPAGDYKFKFDVSDGATTKTFTYAFSLKNADTDPTKNKPPLVTKYESAQAIAGLEYALPILAADKDGDALTITVDESAFPFNSGATFDPESRMFRWTPNADDQGTTTVKFVVTDGDETKKIKVSIKVKIGLFN